MGGALGIFVIAFIISPLNSIRVVITVLSLVYLLDLLFCCFLVFRALHKDPLISIGRNEIEKLDDNNLPIYTVLCPLFREEKVLPQFINSISRLNYPKDKLQVILLLEECDTATIKAAQSLLLPKYFEVVIVPHGSPQTKPRACNLGLQQTRGDYVVIYDAEDIPETDQLRKAAVAFCKMPHRVVCVQAKLDFYNRNHNIITRLFTAEYALLFNLTLLGLQSLNAPIPLGGTSNHFRVDALRKIGGWDPFNVTEDCDLGIRLFTHGYQTVIINSVTFEEANSRIGNWIRQRSRWIKGYLQTLIVHTRSPQRFMRSLKTVPHFATFLLIVGGKTASIMINPILWLITLTYFLGPDSFRDLVHSLYLLPVFYIAFGTWVLGNMLYVFYYLVGLLQRGYPEMIKLFPLIPTYWLLMSIAGWKAVYQLIVKPHYWEKTDHGFHLEQPTGKLRHFFSRRYD